LNRPKIKKSENQYRYGAYSLLVRRFLNGLVVIIISIFFVTINIPAKTVHERLDLDDNNSVSNEPLPENVYNEIDTLSTWYRYLDTSGHKAAENYIFSRFSDLGLNTTRQEYTVSRPDGDARGCNVLGLLEGSCEPDKWLVIGGHYDANIYAASGAYDNAVGAGTVLELARVFTEKYGSESISGPEISILFATWDAEEGGGAGSTHFLNNLAEDITIVSCLNFDMYCLNYPVKNRIPGSQEEYYKLNLYTSPVNDFSGYSDVEYNETTLENFTNFQDLLSNITYEKFGHPSEWVIVMDDTALVSDHRHFIRQAIPAVWFRGMNEYPRDQGDMNERNFKHTPVDTLETMERYAGGKNELIKGIDTGLSIGYELILGIVQWFTLDNDNHLDPDSNRPDDNEEGFSNMAWLIAGVCGMVALGVIYFYKYHTKKKK
jgi:hypothetical protein